MKIKICGMKETGNIREVTALSPGYMGFIFYPMSKRYVGADFEMPEIPSSIKKVGVFVNDAMKNISLKVKKYKLDLIQLHGDESPEFCKRAGARAKVIKAFGVDGDFDFTVISDYEECCDYFLFDSKTAEYGGSGKNFDAGLLKNYKSSKPFFISGGIGVEEVQRLKSQVSMAFAIDVNSKFEIEPGLKDMNKLKLLFDALSGK